MLYVILEHSVWNSKNSSCENWNFEHGSEKIYSDGQHLAVYCIAPPPLPSQRNLNSLVRAWRFILAFVFLALLVSAVFHWIICPVLPENSREEIIATLDFRLKKCQRFEKMQLKSKRSWVTMSEILCCFWWGCEAGDSAWSSMNGSNS